jgi:hypothetical protein
MPLSQAARQLRDQYVKALLDASLPLQKSADVEVALEALIEAAQIVKDKLEQELAELRQETD